MYKIMIYLFLSNGEVNVIEYANGLPNAETCMSYAVQNRETMKSFIDSHNLGLRDVKGMCVKDLKI